MNKTKKTKKEKKLLKKKANALVDQEFLLMKERHELLNDKEEYSVR
jgi:hypothetical protein